MTIHDTRTIKLRRAEAARYLTDHGYRTAIGTLAKLACVGGGPAFVVYGRFPLYEADDLLAWAEARTSGRVSSTSQLAKHVRPSTLTAYAADQSGEQAPTKRRPGRPRIGASAAESV